MRKVLSLFAVLVFFSFSSFSQAGKIPAVITTNFEKQYPTAKDVEYKDALTSVQVHFKMDDAKMIAKYNSKGEWKETEKEWSYDKLPPEVIDGFQKSKYADDWKVKETAVINSSGGFERYRLKVEKNDIQKKYLFFSKEGRLMREAVAL
jgi:hypothetical protein